MKVICGWCKRDLGEKEPLDQPYPISHGICENCQRQLLSQLEKRKEMSQEPKLYKRCVIAALLPILNFWWVWMYVIAKNLQ